MHAFITCRIFHCNALLSGLSKKNIAQLQWLQNSAQLSVEEDQTGSTHHTNFKVSALATCLLQNHQYYFSLSRGEHECLFHSNPSNNNWVKTSISYTYIEIFFCKNENFAGGATWKIREVIRIYPLGKTFHSKTNMLILDMVVREEMSGIIKIIQTHPLRTMKVFFVPIPLVYFKVFTRKVKTSTSLLLL